MKQFEYKIEYVPRYYSKPGMEMDSPSSDTLRIMGLKGWELCSVGSQDSTGTKEYYFKREIIKE